MASKKAPAVTISMPKVDFQAIADDFRYMNPNDPGAWPLIPRVTVLFGLFVLLLLAGWWFLWNDQLDELKRVQDEEVTLKQQFIDKKKQAINLDLYREQLAEIDRSFGALLKQLPSKTEIDALLVEVNQAGLGRGLQFDLFRPAPEQVKDFYAEVPVAVKINGSYHDIGAFAADIARLPRIVTLNNVVVNPGKDGVLSLDSTVKTFRYLDDQEVARQKQAAQGAKK